VLRDDFSGGRLGFDENRLVPGEEGVVGFGENRLAP
jgi:hypothetical protein